MREAEFLVRPRFQVIRQDIQRWQLIRFATVLDVACIAFALRVRREEADIECLVIHLLDLAGCPEIAGHHTAVDAEVALGISDDVE